MPDEDDEEAPSEGKAPREPRRPVDLFAPPPKSDGRMQGRRRHHSEWNELVAAFVAEHYPDPDWAAGNPAKACEAVEQAISHGARTLEQVHEHIDYWWIEPARQARSAS